MRTEDYYYWDTTLELLMNYLDWALLLDYFEDPLGTSGGLRLRHSLRKTIGFHGHSSGIILGVLVHLGTNGGRL